jgi:hypothetical protein
MSVDASSSPDEADSQPGNGGQKGGDRTCAQCGAYDGTEQRYHDVGKSV